MPWVGQQGGEAYRPGGRLGGAGLLEGHVEGVGAGVVGVGGDGGRGGEGVEGGAGLGVGGGGRGVVLSVLIAVGARRGGATILDLLVHTVQEPQVCVLWLKNMSEAKLTSNSMHNKMV